MVGTHVMRQPCHLELTLLWYNTSLSHGLYLRVTFEIFGARRPVHTTPIGPQPT
ncbi:hypothetical protein PAXRUDRAFT_835222 [Paxillus rubicundulus Ve08.2h10]|uniref:Uncharacterized protein n=1 Tax=Paxillus rubicundulus Ve08.2h10 TaxID=930991 RepID=A0A0D0CNH3_9AGAM|nr:hypothetical protein PAXRUDRAFT_835222 [Paxillus rubicundulus Ve08.2h10]